MAGRTPHQAVESFLAPLQQAISYVAHAVLWADGRELRTDPSAPPHSVILQDGNPVRLHGDGGILLKFVHRFRILDVPVEMPDDTLNRGRYKVSTAEYIYELLDQDERLIIGCHDHPVLMSERGVTWPHIHLTRTEPRDLRHAHPPQAISHRRPYCDSPLSTWA
ncbi:MAG: hypothetical protein IT307_18645 [Chloroflexi bacterium]|nr:hypothetical protein [Chloroflexota bacterium]